MKKKMFYVILFATLILVVFILFSAKQPAAPQLAAPASLSPSALQWKKHSGNPVVPEMKKGKWNHWPGDPFVMKDGNAYKMWYGGHSESTEKTQIGYAESANGIKWRHHPNPVVPAGPPGSYDAKDVETPTVLKDGDTYHMWYSVTRGKDREEAIYQIAHATSRDGIQWIKDPKNPVLTSGDLYSWHGLGILEPTVIKEGSTYKMWFVGQGIDLQDQKTIHTRLGYATSADGSVWQEYAGNPILDLSKAGPDQNKIMNSAFFVLYNGKEYELFYLGGDVPDVYAVSPDGLKWKKRETTILPKGKTGQWDSWVVSSPTVIMEKGKYKMWYSGAKIDNSGWHHAIGYAVK